MVIDAEWRFPGVLFLILSAELIYKYTADKDLNGIEVVE